MTISLENAKELYKVAKKYGVKLPESKRWWIRDTFIDNKKFYVFDGILALIEEMIDGKDKFPAYTTNELFEWLVNDIEFESGSGNLLLNKTHEYTAMYSEGINLFEESAKTPANALCKLAIKLIEEGVIK